MKSKNCFETDEIMSGYYVILFIEIQMKINLSLHHPGFTALSFLLGSYICPLNLFSCMVMYERMYERMHVRMRLNSNKYAQCTLLNQITKLIKMKNHLFKFCSMVCK